MAWDVSLAPGSTEKEEWEALGTLPEKAALRPFLLFTFFFRRYFAWFSVYSTPSLKGTRSQILIFLQTECTSWLPRMCSPSPPWHFWGMPWAFSVHCSAEPFHCLVVSSCKQTLINIWLKCDLAFPWPPQRLTDEHKPTGEHKGLRLLNAGQYWLVRVNFAHKFLQDGRRDFSI